jgi:PEP-CTERM motif
VTNAGLLEMDTRETVNGNFSQMRSGSFESLIADDNARGYGALAESGLATLNGTFTLHMEDGFSLGAGESFDIMTFASVKSDFHSLSLDGTMCSEDATDLWSCSNLAGLALEEIFSRKGLDLDVVNFTTPPGSGSSPSPEPSTWAMLVIGFAALGVAASRARRRELSRAGC